MKRYRDFREECIILEHPNLKARILKKINPLEMMKDKMDALRKLPGKVKDKAMDKLQKSIDKINPMSPINKKLTQMRQDKIKQLTDKKVKIDTKSKGMGERIKTLRAKIK